MIAIAIAAGVVGLSFVACVWDATRRMLAAQVRSAELRAEATRGESIAEVSQRVAKIERDLASLEQAHALGRSVRR